MPEYVRRAVSATSPRVLCPALEEGTVLPAGLTDEQRLCLTQGRLSADYAADLLIKKRVAKGYGMGICLIAEEQPMKMMMESSSPPETPEPQGIVDTLKNLARRALGWLKI